MGAVAWEWRQVSRSSARWGDALVSTRAPRDDIARFRAAFDGHYDAVLAYVMRRAADPDDAEEVLSTTFAIAWRRIDRLPPEPFTLTWLYRVAWRTLANQERGNARRQMLARRLALRARSSESDSTDQEALVHEGLARLSPKEREVLRLDAWEELSHAEAAAVLGCSPNAFAIRLHRARQSLRSELGRLGATGPDAPTPSRAKRSKPRSSSAKEER
ncbi:MAG: putative polymerase ECF-subfamily sigma factor [Acidimicrobiaceae bacterium]|nr:putative polymerase ECF-subfamily sigma factor [Acidimicrobiaceae bacterium]